MLPIFLKHQWTAFWRSKGKTGTLAAQLIIGFVMLYIIVVSILVGYSMEAIIEQMLPGKDVMVVFDGMILYYFALDLLVRLQMQDLPTLAIVPYLHLNIPKRKILNFLNVRALFSAFNILPLFVFFPFCILSIRPNYGLYVSVMYLVTVFSLMIFNNYAALYFKRLSATNLRIVIPGLAVLVTVGLLEYFKVFSIATFSNIVFQQLRTYPAIGFSFTALGIVMFLINDRFLRKNLYVEELKTTAQKKSGNDYPFLDRFGAAGTLVALEIKLILRNKRPRSTVAKGVIFLCYGFLFYKQKSIDNNEFAKMLFPAIFMTGNMILLYGQFMFSWQSAEFDGMLANRVNMKTFFKAKLLMLVIGSTLLTLIVSFYGFLSWKIVAMQLAVYLYNIGIGAVIVLFFATLNYKSIDLSKGASMNWQGVGASTMIMALPLVIIPYLIYIPLSLIHPYWGLAGLAITGILGYILRGFFLNLLVREFNKRKYKIAAGFRE